MKQRDPYAVADAILTMRMEMIPFEKRGVRWSAQEVRDLNEHLRNIAAYARDLGNEMMRLRWEARNAAQAYASAIGENVIAFPIPPRPPHGAA